MSDRSQELLGKGLLAGAFAFLLALQSAGLSAMLAADPRPDNWALDFTSRALSLIFVAIVVYMTIRRMPPRSTAHGLVPRFAAISGTFALMLLAVLPTGEASRPMQIFATLLVIIGTIGSIYCLSFLGRSFSIVASARELVTGGPYGIVRHPLYLAEGITTIGIIILHWSVAAAVLGAIQIGLQFWRMRLEEQVLRDAFPEYAGYAARVGMIVPRLKRAPAEATIGG